MAGYLLYFPDRTATVAQLLERHGLESLAAGCGNPSDYPVLDNGPDGGAGKVLCWQDTLHPDRSPKGGVFLADQEWRQIEGDAEGKGGYWIGWEKLKPPRPVDLQRKKLHPGVEVVLEDGNAWTVPVARQLPHLLGIGKARIKDQYKPFWDASYRAVSEWLFTTETDIRWEVPFDDGFQFCAMALSQNYRVNAVVLDILGLIASDNLASIVEAATNGMAISEVMDRVKKNKLSTPQHGQLTSDGELA